MDIKQQLNQKLIGTVACSQHSKAVDFYWDSDFSVGNLQHTIKASSPSP